ncbi:MAG TPA: YhjD/YihY/BrkB family envelope integrity protein [Actinomycetota bacterium]|nr:YhjD/YihY/BrkB family envelope integrity protein [Actinomycetota bacterium]
MVDGQARLEQARARSSAVDAAFGVLRRERPVATGILAAALAFRLFALLIPLAYLLVAGIGFSATAAEPPGPARGDRLRDLVVDSVAAVARTSDRGRFIALIFGGVATLLAAGGVVEVLRWVHVLAWRVPPPRKRRSIGLVLGLIAGAALTFGASAAAERARTAASGLGNELTVVLASAAVQVALLAALWFALSLALPRPAVPWTALVPGALLFAGGFLAYNLAVTLYFAPRAARASAVYGSLGVALVLLVSLFLFGRLAVAAAELNATLWERRTQRLRPNAPPP